MGKSLSAATLSALHPDVSRPNYDRSAISAGIVHLGLGAFHRAHQAIYVDDCLASGQTDWGIVGVSLRDPAVRNALAPQDGLYTHAERGGEGEKLRIVGSLTDLIVAPETPARLLEALTAPSIRIVTLTVTEKAYLRAAAGGLDWNNPGLVSDAAAASAPQTFYGFLAEALIERRKAGLQPFTLLCCDNLPANGATLKSLFLEFARRRDGDLAAYLKDNLACPSTMVDRIVPATTDAERNRISARLGLTDAWPVISEPFSQWVVEDEFSAGRPDWEQFGVTMVRDVKPFELMKLRMLNGSHSALAYTGLLSGHETVASAFSDAAIRSFVDHLWSATASTLPSGELDPRQYRLDLSRRFSNKALEHRLAQIASDGSQKLPQRIIAPALECLHSDRPAGPFALVVAAWIAVIAGAGKGGPVFTDPMLADLQAATARPDEEGMVAAVFGKTGFAAGDRAGTVLQDLVTTRLRLIRQNGIAAALAIETGSHP